jgi:hypothetical protein
MHVLVGMCGTCREAGVTQFDRISFPYGTRMRIWYDEAVTIDRLLRVCACAGSHCRLSDNFRVKVKLYHQGGGTFIPPEPLGKVEVSRHCMLHQVIWCVEKCILRQVTPCSPKRWRVFVCGPK